MYLSYPVLRRLPARGLITMRTITVFIKFVFGLNNLLMPVYKFNNVIGHKKTDQPGRQDQI
jgi:hypothetical protein